MASEEPAVSIVDLNVGTNHIASAKKGTPRAIEPQMVMLVEGFWLIETKENVDDFLKKYFRKSYWSIPSRANRKAAPKRPKRSPVKNLTSELEVIGTEMKGAFNRPQTNFDAGLKVTTREVSTLREDTLYLNDEHGMETLNCRLTNLPQVQLSNKLKQYLRLRAAAESKFAFYHFETNTLVKTEVVSCYFYSEVFVSLFDNFQSTYNWEGTREDVKEVLVRSNTEADLLYLAMVAQGNTRLEIHRLSAIVNLLKQENEENQ